MAKVADYLPENTQLDRFRIDQVLGGGGFSIVYLGVDLKAKQQIAIKEYFPAKLAKRDQNLHVIAKDEQSEKFFRQGRKLFFQEVSLLASLNHPNIVDIVGFCQAYDTIYAAMKYQRGISLQAYIKKHGKHISESFILAVFLPMLDALLSVHKTGLLHLDLKPGNIYLRQSKPPLLLDFGAAHKLMLSAGSRMFPVVSHGFSPPEQSRKNAKLGPWSDIYAIGASMRACIEAKPPMPAKDRIKKHDMPSCVSSFPDEYSLALLKAIDWAMELSIENRPQSVEEFINVLLPLKQTLRQDRKIAAQR